MFELILLILAIVVVGWILDLPDVPANPGYCSLDDWHRMKVERDAAHDAYAAEIDDELNR